MCTCVVTSLLDFELPSRIFDVPSAATCQDAPDGVAEEAARQAGLIKRIPSCLAAKAEGLCSDPRAKLLYGLF